MVRLFVAILSCVCLVECRVLVPDASRVKREAAPALPKVNTTERLGELRALMQSSGVQAYIVPSVDAHMSEYVAPPFQRRQYISGFTGSLGDAVITLDKAAMWTDGRYFNQALMEMDNNWILMKLGQPGTLTKAQWLKQELSAGNSVGIDASLISITDFEDLVKELAVANINVVAISPNLIDKIWINRPQVSNNTIYPLDIKFAGESWQDKVKKLRDDMNAKLATAMVLYKLDEVAWVLNLRGSDVPSNPFFFAFVIITGTAVRVYVSDYKVTEAVRTHLSVGSCSEMCAELLPYNITKLMDDIRAEEAKSNAKIWLSPYSSYELKRPIPDNKLLLEDQPVALRKSIKNPTEIIGMKNAHLKDSVAIVEFFYWLKNEVAKGRNDLTEISASEKLEEFKSAQKDYVGQSFNTIAGYGPNGAIIHYRATPETDTQISDDNIFLVDTGSQYMDGTTDTTRTVHFGEPTAKQKEAYTRVLKGHIALALAVFPNTTQGRFLDPIARLDLWRNGLDYRHGTGHGIGMFLSVHEGPQRISIGCPKPWEKPIAPGMFQSDEPGYYEDGGFGIRLENIVMAVPADTQNTFNDVQYLTFESVAFVPYWKKLIDLDLLTPTDVNWLNEYHKQCREKVGPLLKEQGRSDVNDWLTEITEPISLDAKAGGASLTMSRATFFLAAIGLFILMQ